MAIVNVGQHLVIDPEMLHGRLTFRGTRIRVSTILLYLADGLSVDEIDTHWPQLTPEAVREAILLASDALHQQYAAALEAAECEARRLRDEVMDRAGAS